MGQKNNESCFSLWHFVCLGMFLHWLKSHNVLYFMFIIGKLSENTECSDPRELENINSQWRTICMLAIQRKDILIVGSSPKKFSQPMRRHRQLFVKLEKHACYEKQTSPISRVVSNKMLTWGRRLYSSRCNCEVWQLYICLKQFFLLKQIK